MDVLDGKDRTLLCSATPIVPARHMVESIRFYERLGFVCEPYDDGSQYAFLSRDGQELHLGLMDGAAFTFNAMGVYFVVEDVDIFYDEVRAAGIECLSAPETKPWRMREFSVSDPDETLLRFGQASHLL